MANAVRYGFRPHGAGHQVVSVTLTGTVTKGDLVTGDGVCFAPASHGWAYGVSLKSGVSGGAIPVALIGPETLLEVSTARTFAASDSGTSFDVTGTTGAQRLADATTYKHFQVVGVYPTPTAPDATGVNTNLLVRMNTTAYVDNPRRPALNRTTATLSGTYTISALSPSTVYALDPDGAARNVVLPEAADGLWFKIVNKADAAENLVVKQSDGSTTVCTIGQNEQADVYCTGTTWAADGISVATV